MNRFSPFRFWCGALLVFAVAATSLAQTANAQLNDLKQQSNDSRQYFYGNLPGLVVVGDSLSAGFQNGSLLDKQQRNGYAALVAKQARSLLLQPEIAAPGVPNVLTLTSRNPLVITPAPGVSTGRTDPFLPTNNFAVPGAKVRDTLETRPTLPVDSITDLVLGLPWLYLGVSKSQVEFAEDARPRNIIVWIGNNDALGAALAGNSTDVTALADFQRDYGTLINRLAATKARLFIANIPDVTTIAALTSAEKIAAQTKQPLSIIGPILGIAPGDYVTPQAAALIPQILADPSRGPLPAGAVLTKAEVAQIQTSVNGYNAFIKQKATEKNAVLVDINALVGNVARNGYKLGDGRILTADFLGGLYSLDGVHPTNTGYAIFANEFISRINARYRLKIFQVDVNAVAATDPLVPGNAGLQPDSPEQENIRFAPAVATDSWQQIFNQKF